MQANSSIPVSCTTDYIDNVPSMVVGFRNVREAQDWLRPFAEQIGGPFCDAANRSGREARVYMTVGSGEHEQARRWSCELGKWGNWFSTNRASATPATPTTPATQPPSAAAAATPTMDDVVRVCKNVQANPQIPVSCVTDYVNGVPSVIVGFPSADEANDYMDQVAQKVAQPFCEAANRAGRRASFFITLAGAQARRYDCEGQSWSDWFPLPQNDNRPPPARTST